jgi:hypothetical protein
VAAWHHHHEPKRRTRPRLDADIYLLRSGSFGVGLGPILKARSHPLDVSRFAEVRRPDSGLRDPEPRSEAERASLLGSVGLN